MPPPAKKARMDMNSDSTSTSDGIPQPLVFNAAGFQPDVSLMVFDQDFHVNSVVLKLYSAYFRKFLDSAEKNGPLSGQFAYKYTTVVDPDGMWALEPVAKATEPAPELLKEINQQEEKLTFKRLICAMYHRPYEIVSFNELKCLTNLADFYCALPVVSSSVMGSLLSSILSGDGFLQKIHGDHIHLKDWNVAESALLVCAKKLRCKELFRDCFIHRVASYTPEFYAKDPMAIECPELFSHVLVQQGIITGKIALAQQYLLNLVLAQDYYSKGSSLRFELEKQPLVNRQFFAKLQDDLKRSYRSPDKVLKLRGLVDELLVNNLVLTKSSSTNYILCAKLDDCDLPWNQEETDW